ncbi:MAG: hypothetical protein JO241_11235, partial [Candidatus Eremiobacteraeota bacterium]|nr:hypothetical protein [Candidatus Eremiobacteraeota bacterium]
AANGQFLAYTPIGKQPLALACDEAYGELFVTNYQDVVTVWTDYIHGVQSPVTTTGSWHESGGAVPNTPWGIVIDDYGVHVSDSATDTIQTYDTEGDLMYASGFNAPYGLAEIPQTNGYQYVTERDADAVLRDDILTVLPFPNVHGPFGIRQDPANGYLYVVNYHTDAPGAVPVTRYDTLGNQIALPPNAFAGPHFPLDIEVVP